MNVCLICTTKIVVYFRKKNKIVAYFLFQRIKNHRLISYVFQKLFGGAKIW